ncbi:MAG: ASCH domain-containing protein [Flavobacteriales bacterium]|nr:ASCH domain-containing protein [Flavobacteriales bacterium]
MNVILSIKPKYAKSILSGEKKVEFRKTKFARDVDRIYIYSSSPEQRIIGYFLIENIVEDTPEKLWRKFKDVGAVTRSDFFEYYSKKNIAYAIRIKSCKKFKRPINPKDLFEKFTAPQSYIYYEKNIKE